jgi:hypothetical protein
MNLTSSTSNLDIVLQLIDPLYGQIQTFYQENKSNRKTSKVPLHLTVEHVHFSSRIVVAYEQVSASTSRRGAPPPLPALRRTTLLSSPRNHNLAMQPPWRTRQGEGKRGRDGGNGELETPWAWATAKGWSEGQQWHFSYTSRHVVNN